MGTRHGLRVPILGLESPPLGELLNDFAASIWQAACMTRARGRTHVVKKIDYYAVQSPWRIPKWLGVTLGGIFAVIAIGSVITIVQLTRSTPPVVAVAAAPVAQAAAAQAPAAPATATQAGVAPATDTAPAVASDDDDEAAQKKHGKPHKASKKLASAKKGPAASGTAMDAGKRQTILAKHDSKQKRSEKDALDKLLGL
jgi:hypothetical protein